jgi:cytochrome c oxidase assembly protein subunit 15
MMMSVTATDHDFDRAEAAQRPDAATRGLQPVRIWLYVIGARVFGMVVVGGATRLTGSGLSITEWKPVTGAVPPLTEQAWAVEFEKYRQIPQYQLVNKGMTLGEFKEIYWWEWSHRQLGRAIGLVFGLGFLGFFAAGVLRGRLALKVAALGLLGGLQGAIGWIMVASGLKPGMTAVAPVKLMLHLTTASVILAGLLAVAAGLGRSTPEPTTPRVRGLATATLAAVLFQIALGALVAGSKAGLTYNTWPLMDGRFVPHLSGLFIISPWVENLVDNPLTVQFNHRMMAYALVAIAVAQAWTARRSLPGSSAARRTGAIASLAVAQAALGVATLLAITPLSLGLAHQAFAMLVLSMAAVHWRLTRSARLPA